MELRYIHAPYQKQAEKFNPMILFFFHWNSKSKPRQGESWAHKTAIYQQMQPFLWPFRQLSG